MLIINGNNNKIGTVGLSLYDVREEQVDNMRNMRKLQ